MTRRHWTTLALRALAFTAVAALLGWLAWLIGGAIVVVWP